MAANDIFLGRQPILDQRVVAHELSFRVGNTPGVTVTDDMQATATVIHHAFSEMGIQAVLGTQLGFINISADMLSPTGWNYCPNHRGCWNCLKPSTSMTP